MIKKMKKEIKVPDIAENVEKGTIAAVLVSEGDSITVDQPLVEIETEKASTDIPSPYAGKVDEIKVKEGDEVKVNQVIMIIDAEEEEKKEGEEEQKDKKESRNGEKDDGEQKDNGEKEESEKKGEEIEKKKAEGDDEQDAAEKEKQSQQGRKLSDVPAAPSVRRLAREMDVDLTQVKGSAPGGRIVAEDVRSHAGKPKEEKAKEPEGEKAGQPDFSQWGPVSKENVKTIRRLTGENVLKSWQNIPHVTHFDEADITNLENFRKSYQKKAEKEGVKLTVTAILLKITGFALQKFPKFNASLLGDEIVYKHYYNVGVAVDTPQGLLVPVIRDINSKSLIQVSLELDELAQKARDKKISPDEMQGGNFTISNLGGIGGTAFTPIVLPPQVAILGVSKADYKPVYIGEELQKRMIIPLAVSYDHRIIDGADGARFLRWICNVIEDPFAILQ
jgi:pyruvate dehydrogenase E2 component (dihydrolipoamide acetyltransferase)